MTTYRWLPCYRRTDGPLARHGEGIFEHLSLLWVPVGNVA